MNSLRTGMYLTFLTLLVLSGCDFAPDACPCIGKGFH